MEILELVSGFSGVFQFSVVSAALEEEEGQGRAAVDWRRSGRGTERTAAAAAATVRHALFISEASAGQKRTSRLRLAWDNSMATRTTSQSWSGGRASANASASNVWDNSMANHLPPPLSTGRTNGSGGGVPVSDGALLSREDWNNSSLDEWTADDEWSSVGGGGGGSGGIGGTAAAAAAAVSGRSDHSGRPRPFQHKTLVFHAKNAPRKSPSPSQAMHTFTAKNATGGGGGSSELLPTNDTGPSTHYRSGDK